MNKKQWLVLLVMGAVGCSKVNLPRLGEGGRVGPPDNSASAAAAAKSNAARRANSFNFSSIKQVCDQFQEDVDGEHLVLLERRISEYPQLQAQLRNMSKILRENPGLLQNAHFDALMKTNKTIERRLEAINSPGPGEPTDFYDDAQAPQRVRGATTANPLLGYFRQSLQVNLKKTPWTGDQRDLEMMVNRVMMLREGDSCASVYLRVFYSNYIKSLDALGSVVFGNTSEVTPPDTLSLPVGIPKVFSETQLVWNRTNLKGDRSAWWLTLTHWSTPDGVEAAIPVLEANVAQGAPHKGVVIDLRYADGTNLKLVQRALDSAEKAGWGSFPLVILTNKSTRGAAAVFAYRIADLHKGTVKILGTSPRTYGFGRSLMQARLQLQPGLSEVNVRISNEVLLPPGESNSDGYRLNISQENVLAFVNPDIVINLADELALREGGVVAPVQQTAPAAAQSAPHMSETEVRDALPAANNEATPQGEPIAAPQPLPVLEVPADVSASEARNGAPPRAFGP